ncbi:MAG TPA: hypothetical protein VFQ38_02260 [Longimicrobiales bacterium]|nr:hypothetical protein [Longimicrobiales bacterium]
MRTRLFCCIAAILAAGCGKEGTGAGPGPTVVDQIAYLAGGNLDLLGISRVAVDGSAPREVISPRDSVYTFAWSPDGQRMAYRRNRKPGIWIVAADGGTPQQVYPDQTVIIGPEWSPDGGSVLFTAFDGHTAEIALVAGRADGSRLTRLARDSARQGVWSPRGDVIAFATEHGIYLVNPSGTGLRPLRTGLKDPYWLEWAPDGSRLAFDANAGGQIDVMVLGLDGVLVNVSDSPAEDRYPHWAPDSRRLAFDSDRTGGRQTCLVNADGSELAQPAFLAGAAQLHWSPNARLVAFYRDRGLYVATPEGAELRTVAPPPLVYGPPMWRPRR